MRRPVVGIAAVGMTAALVVWGAFALVAKIRGPQYEDFTGSGGGEVVIEVMPGQTLTQIGRTLETEGVVKDYRKFAQVSDAEPKATSITPGFYALREQMAAQEALALLLDPESRLINRMVIPEGTRLARIATVLAAALDVADRDVSVAIKDVKLPVYAKTAEGYFFPATYELQPNDTPISALQSFVDRFAQSARAVDLEARSQLVGFTPHEIVTIASIIEAEVDPQDFGKAARVIYNRLERGMKLQMDSTVNYALGGTKLMFTPQQLQTESPFNTYVINGLPPGPIGSPGQAALEAALSPEAGEWLWFVSVNPDAGETKFATTEGEFWEYREQFQQWYRDNR